MKTFESDILHEVEKVEENNQLINALPKTPQQRFMVNYATLHFLNKGCQLPILHQLLQKKTGSTSQLLLRLKYMKQCMENKVNLDNKDFHVLNTLVLWMQQLQKISKHSSIKLVNSTLLPHPHQLKFDYYQQFIIYLNYLAVDIQNLFKTNTIHWQPDDLILFLQIVLPRIYFNVILPPELMEGQRKDKNIEDVLFCNSNVEYITRTRFNYRGLCKIIVSYLISLELTPTQCRNLIDIACRYYLLFWADSKQNATQIFLKVFNKCTEAVRFSLTDELLLFFKVCQKLQATDIEQQLRLKFQWVNTLLQKYKNNIIGHPKDDVNPFNPLNLKEKITVEAGKTVERTLQIFKDETIFYFTILIGDNDINLRLFYLGDFQSKVEVKKLLHFDEKKSGQNRFAYMAGKRGMYMVQFDNSYSWINSKTIKFQYVVLTPHQLQQENPIWYNKLFQLNAPSLKRQPHEFLQKMEKPEISSKENIEVHKLEEIYSSQQYQHELEEQQQIHISSDYSPKNTIINKPQQKSKTFEIQIKKKEPESQDKKKEEGTSRKQGNEREKVQKKEGDERQKQIKKEKIQKEKSSTKEGNEKEKQEKKKQQTIDKVIESKQVQKIQKKEQLGQKLKSESNVSQNEKTINIVQKQTLPQDIRRKDQGSFAGQANLSLIDNIFSLLVSTEDHTYQFQTNLQDRINKRLKSYCGTEKYYQWIVNSEARDWLKKNGFIVVMKGGVNYLTVQRKSQQTKRQSSNIVSQE